MNATITVSDTASESIRAIIAQVSPERLNPRLGAAAAVLVRAHLAEKESGGNKNGWPSTHFYANAARSVFWRADSHGATVTISQTGFAQRYFGGTILPGKSISEFTGQPTKYLTIPARSEAYGVRAGEMGNLKVLWGKNGPFALAADEGGATKRIFQGREGARPEQPIKGLEQSVIVYWLVKSVHQEADHSVLPSDAQFHEVLATTALSAVRRIRGGS